MNAVERIAALAEEASERPWQSRQGYGALVTQGRSANPASGADDVEYYGGSLVGESIGPADREFICALVNAWPQIREALEAGKALRDAHEAWGRTANGSDTHLVSIAQQEAAHASAARALEVVFGERALAVREVEEGSNG